MQSPKWHTLGLGHFSTPALLLCFPESLDCDSSDRKRPPRCLITSDINWINCAWCAPILNSSLTPDGSWATRLPHLHRRVWMESPLKQQPGCVIATPRLDQYIPLKFIPIRRLVKTAHVVSAFYDFMTPMHTWQCSLCSESAEKRANAKKKQ